MKKMMLFAVAMTVLIMPCGVFAEDRTTVTTTENAGTISEVSPDTLVIRSETSSSPMHYSHTKKTTYVDERGMPVSMKTVKSGLPVTVYYTTEGSKMVADKVVVRKTTSTTTEKPMMERKTTTTETR